MAVPINTSEKGKKQCLNSSGAIYNNKKQYVVPLIFFVLLAAY